MIGNIIDKLLGYPAIAILIIGLVALLAAAGGIHIGDFQYQIVEAEWRLAIGAVGGILVVLGILALGFDLLSRRNPFVQKPAISQSITPTQKPLAAPLSHPSDPRLKNLVSPISTHFKILEVAGRKLQGLYKLSTAPTGLLMIDNVPFILAPAFDDKGILHGHFTIDVQPNEDNIEQVEEIHAEIEGISKVHFLISAGYGWPTREGVQFLDKPIGYIEFKFTDGTSQLTRLVLGKSIREWAFGNSPELVKDIDYMTTRPAWISHDNYHLFDIMSIEIDDAPKNLSTLRIVGKLGYDPKKSLRMPATIISAITCERAD